MKAKTAVIAAAVCAVLFGGGGYGVYRFMQQRKAPIDVVPVGNVNMGYWDSGTQSLYGTVTSQVAQTVVLDDEYQIEEIYVQEGDTVKEGTPLFSYDMTLQELELEMEQLDLRTQELLLEKLERELEKLKTTGPSASLSSINSVLTSSAEEIIVENSEEIPGAGETPGQSESGTDQTGQGESGAGQTGQTEQSEPGTGQTGQTGQSESGAGQTGQSESGTGQNGTGQNGSGNGGQITGGVEIQIEGIQEMADPGLTAGEGAEAETLDGSGTAIQKRLEILEQSLQIVETGFALQDVKADDVEADIYGEHGAETYLLAYFCEKKEENGYVLSETAVSGLTEDERARLNLCIAQINQFTAQYVELRIAEASAQGETSADRKAVERARAAYENLTSEQKELVEQGARDTLQGLLREQITVKYLDENGNAVAEAGAFTAKADETVTLTALQEEQLLAEFLSWEIEAPEELKNQIPAEALQNPQLVFTMPKEGVTVTARYRSYEDQIKSYVDSFQRMYSELASAQTADESYLNKLANTIVFYQTWLAERMNTADGTSDTQTGQTSGTESVIDELTGSVMENYRLKDTVAAYLAQNAGQAGADADTLAARYKELCMKIVRTAYTVLNPSQLDGDALERAAKLYDALGPNWQAELELQWYEEQSAASGSTAVMPIGDSLKAYPVLLQFQNFKKLDPGTPEEERLAALQSIMAAYSLLTREQQEIVEADQEFVSTMQQYGLWDTGETESETESESEAASEFYPDGFDDFGDGDFGYEYTAEEIQQMIKDKEREIRECKLDIREKELSVNQSQRVVDGKTVKSTMDGTVISVGTADGSSEYDYFLRVASDSGLYAQGSMNELDLEKIRVGDTISGMMTDTGVGFTAVIKEISEYPDPNGSNMSFGYGMENTNASYYPFYALLDSTEDIDEGEAEIQLSETMSYGGDGIYLESYFVRDENDGRSYVWKQGEDGRLTKQYVTKRMLSGGYAVQILSGLTEEDKIAFPYGRDVVEGASTREVEMLELY